MFAKMKLAIFLAIFCCASISSSLDATIYFYGVDGGIEEYNNQEWDNNSNSFGFFFYGDIYDFKKALYSVFKKLYGGHENGGYGDWNGDGGHNGHGVPVPEPSTYLIMASMLALGILLHRKRMSKATK